MGEVLEVPEECTSLKERLVMRDPPKLGVVTLCRLMDDCLPAQIENAQDMQKLCLSWFDLLHLLQ